MPITIIVREDAGDEANVETVRFILSRYVVDYDEKGPYLSGVAAHFKLDDLPQEARRELMAVEGVAIVNDAS